MHIEPETLRRALAGLSHDASEFGVNRVVELGGHSRPTPLEFLRLVMEGQPAVFRAPPQSSTTDFEGRQMDSSNPTTWPAFWRWTNKDYLKRAMNGRNITVAVTPNGLADAVFSCSNIGELFCLPHEESMPFDEFLEEVESDARNPGDNEVPVSSGAVESFRDSVYYYQSQNNNMRDGDMTPLFSDVPPDIGFCTEALGHPPDAINFWLGSHRAFTSCHKDHYENLYVVISGTKTFTLIPPTSTWALKERTYSMAKWVRQKSAPPAHQWSWSLEPVMDDASGELFQTRWFSEEPDSDAVRKRLMPDQSTKCADDEEDDGLAAHQISVTLRRGDMLYLPALWGHQVAQTPDDDCSGVHVDDAPWLKGAIAVNYWYDMSYGRAFSYHTFARRIAATAGIMEKES
ncbi:cupin-like domain-containing protein [Zopfochytrium polystomum]|nr:cupin-like domain-containing protein [Zopfochytrium polystomum]